MQHTTPSSPDKALSQGLAAAQACHAQGITDPANEIPALHRVVRASRFYQRAVRERLTAEALWRDFAAKHGYDDPAHEEHRQRTLAARQALSAQEAELSNALALLDQASGA